MTSYKVTTEFGTFNVKHEGDLLSVGGKKHCVQIMYKKNDVSEMISLQTKYGGCELTDKVIKGQNTVIMTLLAFTLFKELHPEVEELYLIDSSTIDCDGSSMGLMKSSLLLHGYTYYERKFNAIPALEDDITIIQTFRNEYNKPWSAPPEFSFMNESLEKLLRHIFVNSKSWSDFSKNLIATFGERDVCRYIYPWFLNAMYKLSPKEITSRWKINIMDKESIPYKKSVYGGNKTRKQKTQYKLIYNPIIDTSKIMSMNF
jgi:hypothetical protein